MVGAQRLNPKNFQAEKQMTSKEQEFGILLVTLGSRI
jgi:hypothetical protein